jgi:catechol 2,3-dioxygenase-like lactoylglutathione lyase family enzyme
MHARVNHVSVNAVNLAESVEFYVELFGARPIATPNFGLPVQWLGLGDTHGCTRLSYGA